MPWLFLLACILLVVGEAWSYFVARKRMRELFAYVEGKHPDFYGATLKGARPSDRVVGDFLRSSENFGDANLDALKKRALFASKFQLVPLLVVLGLMVALYVFSSVLGLLK